MAKSPPPSYYPRQTCVPQRHAPRTSYHCGHSGRSASRILAPPRLTCPQMARLPHGPLAKAERLAGQRGTVEGGPRGEVHLARGAGCLQATRKATVGGRGRLENATSRGPPAQKGSQQGHNRVPHARGERGEGFRGVWGAGESGGGVRGVCSARGVFLWSGGGVLVCECVWWAGSAHGHSRRTSHPLYVSLTPVARGSSIPISLSLTRAL